MPRQPTAREAGRTTGTTSFGALLRAHRVRAGLTQEELAERAGLTPHGVGALERGARTRPYPHTVRSLADALGLGDDDRAALVSAVAGRGRSRDASVLPDDDRAPASRAAGAAPLTSPGPALVVPPTVLHGRADDIAAVVAAVRGGARLVTLTGPGGVGKTRLVAAAAAALAVDHPDGSVAVPLVPLLDPADVLPAVAHALGVEGDGADAVVARLTGCRFLLVLDNFEHLLPAAQDVGHLVASCPDVTVLVTSRAPLRVRGERELPVQPLALPPSDARTVADLVAAPAGALAVDRAAAAAPGASEPGPEDVAALARLCHLMSGLPLALELATARLRLLTPVELLGRLDQVTAAAAARDLPERQRTMRAALDWSHDLLTEPERTVFRLLGVFRGAAVLEAVEHVVTAGSGLPRDQVLGLLAALVEHSLVTARRDDTGTIRYGMLEPVAQYARTLLTGEEHERAVAAHAGWAAEVAERVAVALERDEQVAWLARTRAEESDLVLAAERSLEHGDVMTSTRIVWSLWLYWWLRGQVSTWRRAAEQVLEAAGDTLPSYWLARLQMVAASMAFAGDDVPGSAVHWDEALRLAGDDVPQVAAGAVAGTGLTALASGDLVTARERFQQALVQAERAGEDGVWLRSLTHVWLGTVALHSGDPETAVAEAEAGLALARGRGDRLSSYVALFTLSQAALADGRTVTAREHMHDACRLSMETGDAANLAYVLDLLAVVASAEGDHARVPLLVGAAQGLRETVASTRYGYYLPDRDAEAVAAARARELLGADAYDDAVDRGRGLDLAGTAALALDT